MNDLKIVQNESNIYINSTKNNDTHYTFPLLNVGTYNMQGYNGNT